MKQLILLVFLVCSILEIQATNYYFKSTGSDTNTGLSDAQAWQHPTKLNFMNFANGDSILFKRGDTFAITGIVYSYGVVDGGRLVYGAYGTGAKPIITAMGSLPGWNTVGNWTNTSGNIWTFTYASSILRLWINGTEVRTVMSGTVNSTDIFDYNSTSDILTVYSVGNPATTFSSMTINLYDKAFHCQSKGNITFINLDVQGSGTCFRLDAGLDNYIFDSCNIGFNSQGRGIMSLCANNTQSIDNVIVRNCNFRSNDKFIYTGYEALRTFAGIDAKDGCNNWQVYNCYFENWGHSCIDVEASLINSGYSANNWLIHHNTMTCPDIYYGRGIGFVTNKGFGTNNKFYKNYVYNCPVQSQISGQNIEVYYNIFDNNNRQNEIIAKPYVTSAVFSVYQGYDIWINGMKIYNNVFANGYDYGFLFGGTANTNEYTGLEFTNNIIFNCANSTRSENYQLRIWDHATMKGNTWKNNRIYLLN